MVKARQPLAQRGVEELQAAHVQPEAADEREEADLDDDEQGHFDDDVAEADELAGAMECGYGHGGVQGNEQKC